MKIFKLPKMGGKNMLKVYGLLMRKWMDELQSGMWEGSSEYIKQYDAKQAAYTKKMNKLYNRLEREYGFTREKFYALQDQSTMF